MYDDDQKIIASVILRIIVGAVLIFNFTILAVIGFMLMFPLDEWGPGEEPPPPITGEFLLLFVCIPSIVALFNVFRNRAPLAGLLCYLGVTLIFWTFFLKSVSGDASDGMVLYLVFSLDGLILAGAGGYSILKLRAKDIIDQEI